MTDKDLDLDAMLTKIGGTPINRRGFLAAAGYSSFAAFLAACTSGGQGASVAPSVAPSTAASVAPSTAASVAPTPAPSFKTETDLIMYNWSDYVSKKNMADFKAEYGVKKFQYDIFDNNDVLMAKLQAGGARATTSWPRRTTTCRR